MSIRRSLLPALALLLLASATASAAPPGGSIRRATRAGSFTLRLDGGDAGQVAQVDVPMASSDVVVEKLGPDHIARKHIGGVRYPDISFTVGANASKPVHDWIAASWQMNHQRKNGTLGNGDTNVEFFNALVTEIGMPAVDTAAKSQGVSILVRMAPEYVRQRKAKGKSKPDATAPTPLSPTAVSFRLDGLETAKVQRVDAFTIKQTVSSNEVGETRDYQKEPANVEFPNLSIYVERADAQAFYDWHEDFVIKGNNGQGQEKAGVIAYFGQGAKEAAWEVVLFNVGIFAMDEVLLDDRRLVKIDLYVEQMGLRSGPEKVGAAGAPGRKVSKRKPVPGRIPSGKMPKN